MSRHYLLISLGSWGHCRPETNLALRLVQTHAHLRITLLVADVMRARVDQVVQQYALTAEEQTRFTLEQYSFASAPPGHPHMTTKDDAIMYRFACWLADEIEPYIVKVLADAPAVAIVDFFIGFGLNHRLPKLWADAGLPEPVVHMLAPLCESFVASVIEGDLPLQRAIDEYSVLIKELDPTKAYERAVLQRDESLDERLGNGEVYPWEMDPCWSAQLANHMTTWKKSREAVRTPAYPFICVWPAVFSTYPFSRPVLSIGPQLSPSNPDTTVTPFLDRCEPRSVIYICFGSEFHPPTAHQAELLFDALAKTRFNVVYIGSGQSDETSNFYGSKMETADAVLVRRTQGLGNRGFVTQWCDQWSVLGHASIAWFISHCGSNSAQEAMLRGVPIIAWPGAWDQPVIARQLAHHGAAIELVQTRHNTGKVTATGVKIVGSDEALAAEFDEVFASLDGERGVGVREAMRKLGDRVREDMERGQANRNMEALGHL